MSDFTDRDIDDYYLRQIGPPPRLVCYCEECGEPIYEDDDIYDFGDERIHAECLEEYMRLYRTTAYFPDCEEDEL